MKLHFELVKIRGREYMASIDKSVQNHPQMVGKLVTLARTTQKGKVLMGDRIWTLAGVH